MSARWHVPVLVVLFVALSFGGAFVSHSRVSAQDARVTILGSVVDSVLAPVAGADVVLERDGRPIAATKSGPDGEFRFAAVSPGSYRIRASVANLPPTVKAITIDATASIVRLPIVLASSRSVTSDKAVEAIGESPVDATRLTSAVAALPAPPAMPQASSGRGAANAYEPYRKQPWYRPQPNPNPSYAHLAPNRFTLTREEPLSTFGADVDTASYANVRRFLNQGQLPPADAVRVEEFVNYFRFDYAAPRDGRPLALTTEMADCPWAPSHKLVLIGARAKSPAAHDVRGRNIVLLVDVSGSMTPAERLPLLKSAFAIFADTLRPDDRLAIVTYAGYSGVALPSTPARDRDTIRRAIAGLGAGGSTNGAQGLITAYRVARENYVPGGVNRVILATDGDFNVGVVSRQELLRLIEREKTSGVFLSVLGVGDDNLKDATLEMLADKGNGNYAYLDSLKEARRVLVREGDSTLETVAKDVKFQVEFNPDLVAAWKLIGYENRALAAEDFNDDRKDGGELGAGHTVTMLYEVVPVGATFDDRNPDTRPAVDPLKYRLQPARAAMTRVPAAYAGEWMTVKARYKSPDGDVSDVMSQTVRAGGAVRFLPFASAVAEYGLLLRDVRGDVSRWKALARRAAELPVPAGVSADRSEFVELVELATSLAGSRHVR